MSMTLLAVVCWSCDGCETEENGAPHREGKSTFTLGPGQHNASRLRPAIGCWYTSGKSSASHPGRVTSRDVLTDDTRLACVELLGEVDIVDGTRRGRLVMRVETRSTYTRSDNVVAAVAVSTWDHHRPCRPCSSLCITKSRERRPGRCVLSEFSHSLPCSRAATPRGLQLPSIYMKEVLKIAIFVIADACKNCVV